MFEKIMDFVQEDSMTITNPRNTYEQIPVISCKELEEFLRDFLHEEENENHWFSW